MNILDNMLFVVVLVVLGSITGAVAAQVGISSQIRKDCGQMKMFRIMDTVYKCEEWKK
jgi:hypothetical protein